MIGIGIAIFYFALGTVGVMAVLTAIFLAGYLIVRLAWALVTTAITMVAEIVAMVRPKEEQK